MARLKSTSKSASISAIGEFGLINKLRKKCGQNSSDILAGIGDDAAILKGGKGKTLITTDMMIEAVHFDLSYTTFYQLGHKFLAINLSDIFAMGGRPAFFVTSLGIPDNYRTKNIDELYSGIMHMAKKFKVNIVGGDTCASKKGLILSGTLIGYADKPVSRSGAKPGDGIFVTDAIGDSSTGLQLLRKRKKKVLNFTSASARMKLIRKHLMPDPAPLKSTNRINSMIDISDGLLKDLSHICDESKTGAIIYENKIPLSTELKATAHSMRMNPLSMALSGGEDYSLLFTAPKSIKTKAHLIGEITKRGRFIVDESGNKHPLKPEGFEHFKYSKLVVS